MRLKRKTKIFVLLMTVVLLISGPSFFAKAEGINQCTHGGENFDIEIHAEEIDRDKVLSYFPGVAHPCYVQGEIISCQTYYDKFLVHYRCRSCKKVIISRFEYSNLYHEYRHN